ncbi:hypothetical protein [Rhizobium sp. BK176]|uniref:hypothetical protein n=1 Tax=Rhizobium sp. BK176 TaxID=2587071 RepID=UPI00216768BC|nr:hypothetical protein [Rhizobium sp. BK176]MCS4089438.1 hypothetical protein [Rhizobium sp. BK176]
MSDYSLSPKPIDDETALRLDQEQVRSLALTTATLFRDGNKIGANATIEKMLEVYAIQMRAPHSQHWTSLPSLGAIQKLMVAEYANAEGITDRQAAEFGKAVDAKMRQAFEAKIPRLKQVNISSVVSLDAMQSIVGHIMIERDEKVAELSAPMSGVLGRIRSRFMAQKGGDWNDNYMADMDEKTFGNAVAFAARNVSLMMAASDSTSLDEIKFLADFADAHGGPHRMASAAREDILGIEANRPFQPSAI